MAQQVPIKLHPTAFAAFGPDLVTSDVVALKCTGDGSVFALWVPAYVCPAQRPLAVDTHA